MDSIFWVRKDVTTNNYVDLLEEWNQFSNEEINKWLANENANFDAYNQDNLRMSGVYLWQLIKTKLWRMLEPTLKGNFEGPRIFVAII